MEYAEQYALARQLATDVLSLARNTLFINLRFLDEALFELSLKDDPQTPSIGVDGRQLFFNPVYVLQGFQTEKPLIMRDFLHVVLHCVFRHFSVGSYVDKELWDLACNMAVENIIHELSIRQVITSVEQEQQAQLKRLTILKPLTAEKIYSHLYNANYSEAILDGLKQRFSRDDHSRWYGTGDPQSGDSDEEEPNSDAQSDQSGAAGQQPGESESNGGGDGEPSESNSEEGTSPKHDPSLNQQALMEALAQLSNHWKEISERIDMNLETLSKEQGIGASSLRQNISAVNRDRCDYRAFLKKFAVLGEAMVINDEEFDYVYYTYGLTLYENMPLIEPLEYKEVKRIKDFVIAIDTSGSVSGKLVQDFLSRTYSILKSTESFFTKVNIHIIQCDAQIQDHRSIKNIDEFEDYINTVELKGFGGTDFRPVFNYVDKLVDEGAFTRLKGLIYFTDGYGTFPARKPKYTTAFAFLDDELGDFGLQQPTVPPWAIRVELTADDIRTS